MISEELLGEVLGLNIYGVRVDVGTVTIDHENGMPLISNQYINIYELAHKCILHFYDDYIFSLNAYNIIVTKICINESPKEVYEHTWVDTPYKIEETFKACEWVLSNIKK